jgi:hypothetical protein
MYILSVRAKLNGRDPQAWLADVLCRFTDHPASQLHELLPWHWKHRPRDHAASDTMEARRHTSITCWQKFGSAGSKSAKSSQTTSNVDKLGRRATTPRNRAICARVVSSQLNPSA